MRVDDHFLDRFHALDEAPSHRGSPPSKKLSLLVRTAFAARPGRTYVWGDWANIEARVLPWLAASKGAEAKLEIFRENDRDPTKPDIYIMTAADLRDEDPAELWARYLAKDKAAKAARQAQGKVPELSLGFGGGLGALQAMAVNYGVYLDDKAAAEMIQKWRLKNSWAKSFWGAHGRDGSYGLWGAINSAIENPDEIHSAGRVAYVYDRTYMSGTLFCALPSGRLLTYPRIKWEWREVENKETGKLEDRYQLTYLKQYGRTAMWYGKAAENITQAEAASVLRRTLRKLEFDWRDSRHGGKHRYCEFMPVVMHTHDEVLTEPWEQDTDEADADLRRIMETNGEWDAGLPLKADIKINWYYTKASE